MDNDLALKIYIKARATPKVVAAFAERREFDKILIYSKQVKTCFNYYCFCSDYYYILVFFSNYFVVRAYHCSFVALGWVHSRLSIPSANHSSFRSSGIVFFFC